MKDFQPDLTAVGYTSVFIHFPETPLSPPVSYGRVVAAHTPACAVATSPKISLPQRGLKHFRSLTALKSVKAARSRTPSSPVAKPLIDSKRSQAVHNATLVKRKKSKYDKLRPAPLATDLAIAQIMDGGSLDAHAKQFTRAQAKAGGAKTVGGHLVGVGGVYRDEHGGVWVDEDEEWEFAHLLSSVEDFYKPDGDEEWVRFASGNQNAQDGERRESVSTQDSDLSHRYAVQVDTGSHDDLAGLTPEFDSFTVVKPGLSILAIPARSRRTAKHLRKPGFLLDAFPIPRSPSNIIDMPLSPLSPRFAPFHATAFSKGKGRRRPTPLKLSPPSPASKLPLNPSDPDQIRREFLDDSFAPYPRGSASLRPLVLCTNGGIGDPITDGPAVPRKAAARASIANMKGIFRTTGGRKPHAA